MKWSTLALLTALATGAAVAKADPDVVYLGFLERGGRTATELNSGMPPLPRVRAVFESHHGEWRAIHEEARDQTELRESRDW